MQALPNILSNDAIFASLVIVTVPSNASQAINIEPNVSLRTNAVCTYTREQWAAQPAQECNCTNLTAHWPPVDPAIDLPCWLACDATYPLIFGSVIESSFRNCTIYQGPTLYMAYNQVNFTNVSALRTYMALNETIQRFLPGYYEDPMFNFTAGKFMGELAAAWFNDRMHREKNGQVRIWFSPDHDNVTCTKNGTFTQRYQAITSDGDPSFSLATFGNWPIHIPAMIDVANRLILGGTTNFGFTGEANTLAPYGLFYCVYPEDPGLPGGCVNGDAYQHDASRFWWRIMNGAGAGHGGGIPANSWNNGGATNWTYGADAMSYILELYNSAFGGSDCPGYAPTIPNASRCFFIDRQAQPRPPIQTDVGVTRPVVNTSDTDSPRYRNTDQMCTWLPEEYLLPAPGVAACNCSSFASLVTQYYVNVSNASNIAALTNLTTLGSCLIGCMSTDVFPFILGMRHDDCRFTEFCFSHAYQWSTLEDMRNATSGLPFTAALAQTANMPNWDFVDDYTDASITSYANGTQPQQWFGTTLMEGRMIAELTAAHFNLNIQKQMQPNLTVFYRTKNDPLFSCFAANSTARQMFSGQRVDIVVDVLEKMYMGMSTSHYGRCSYLYEEATPHRNFCEALVKGMPRPCLGADFLSIVNTAMYPALRAFNAFRHQCYAKFQDPANVSNECFVASTFVGGALPPQGLPGTIVIDDDLALPPITFVSPEYPTLPSITVENIPVRALSLSFYNTSLVSVTMINSQCHVFAFVEAFARRAASVVEHGPVTHVNVTVQRTTLV